ncbi:cell wall-binding repeat-containing protein [Miniphocaeibacter halophilus]|uniref:Cell wall-binding repeat-containing protein n=1 Tax=Miniphocaeibacter halophilus TaxID=2931922 RepID=A0AC61MT79_9FIRM|nr:cell wall-binding repeat-containing protein [Miniphocaeibacter halophilus]QQK07436.1 cell wall-binding repeat-containing protein [Miniphocaeibacter halophilus]
MKKKKILSLLLLSTILVNTFTISYATELETKDETFPTYEEETSDTIEKEDVEPTNIKDTTPTNSNENLSTGEGLYGSNVDNSIDEGSVLEDFLDSDTIIKRISGNTRIETAISVSKFQNIQADKVIIADARKYADALSGSSLTFGEYPILLVDRVINSSIINEIIRLKAKEIIILGGENSISSNVESQLNNIANVEKVTRISGADRFDTSVQISKKTVNNNLIVASGESFPDALSASILAINKADLVLTNKNKIPNSLAYSLQEFTGDSISLVGGVSTINNDVLNNIKNTTNLNSINRISGSNRFDTSTKVASSVVNNGTVIIASGESFPDALSASTLAQKINAPILLVEKYVMDNSVINYIKNNNIIKAIVLGGSNTISENTMNNIERLITGQDVVNNTKPISLGEYVVINSEQNTYISPDLNSKVVGKFTNKLILKVLDQNDTWAKVNYDTTTGWVEKKYLSNYSPLNFGKVVNDVPYISQLKPVYAPNGCEPTSLLMGLQGKGYTDIGLRAFLDNMPKHSSNPQKGYVGIPYNSVSDKFQTIDPEPLANYGKKYGNVVNIQGASINDIIREIQNGNTVVAYVTLFWNNPTYKTLPIEGKNARRIWNNHVVLITGYDPKADSFYIADPYNHEKAGANRSKSFYYWKNRSIVEKLYNYRKFAVVIR